jgi:hypothetical protein
MARIRVIFRPDGDVVHLPEGYGGELCHDATRPYEKAQGGDVRSVPTHESEMEPVVARKEEEQHERA